MKKNVHTILLAAFIASVIACKQDDLGTQNAINTGTVLQPWQTNNQILPNPNQLLSDPLSAAANKLRIQTLTDSPSANISALFDPQVQAAGIADLGGFIPANGLLTYDWQAVEKDGNLSLTIQVNDRLDPDLKYAVQNFNGSSTGTMQVSIDNPEVIEGFAFSNTVTITAPGSLGTIDNISLSFRDMTTCWTRFGPTCLEQTPLQGDTIALIRLSVLADNSKFVIEQYEAELKKEKFNNTLKVVSGITGIFGGGGGGFLGGLFGR